MQVKAMLDILGAEFYTGVPDSLLKPLCWRGLRFPRRGQRPATRSPTR